MVEKLFPDPFLKVKIEHVSGSIVKSFIQLVFVVCQVEDYQNISKLSSRSFSFNAYKAYFQKNKKKSGELVSLPHFLHVFWRKIFLLLYDLYWPNFIVALRLLREILGNMRIVTVSSLGCDVANSEINLNFLIKPFFLQAKKVKAKTQVSWEW